MSMCEICIHKNVCKYKTELENLQNDIAKVTPTWAPDRYVISIECKNYYSDIVRPRIANYNIVTEKEKVL